MDTTYILTLIVVINAVSAAISNLSHPRRPLNAAMYAGVAAISIALHFIAPAWSAIVSIILLIGAGLISRNLKSAESQQQVYQEQTYQVQRKSEGLTMTKVLMGLNVIGFIVELAYGASDDPEKVVLLGAVYTPLVITGDWWRLITAQYLHFGVLHLACNMIGMSALGPFVERVYGKFKFFLLYTIAGTAGLGVVVLMYYLRITEQPAILVGASAGVLGLVGITGGFLSRLYLQDNSSVSPRQLRAVGQIIVLQTVFDMMVPQVSSTAHLGGAFFGFLLGFLVPGKRR